MASDDVGGAREVDSEVLLGRKNVKTLEEAAFGVGKIGWWGWMASCGSSSSECRNFHYRDHAY